jgi:S1-C subfamily serine protease
VAQAVRSVVIVSTAHGTGAGVAVGDARVVTAAHVIDGATTVQLHTAGGRGVQATVVRRDPQRDIAILIAPGLDLPVAPLRSQRPDLGDPVYAVGAPMGDYLQLTAGIVSALPDEEGVAYIQTDARAA